MLDGCAAFVGLFSSARASRFGNNLGNNAAIPGSLPHCTPAFFPSDPGFALLVLSLLSNGSWETGSGAAYQLVGLASNALLFPGNVHTVVKYTRKSNPGLYGVVLTSGIYPRTPCLKASEVLLKLSLEMLHTARKTLNPDTPEAHRKPNYTPKFLSKTVTPPAWLMHGDP